MEKYHVWGGEEGYIVHDMHIDAWLICSLDNTLTTIHHTVLTLLSIHTCILPVSLWLGAVPLASTPPG